MADVANVKQEKVVGSDTNYYLVLIEGKDGNPDTTVEVEDIIEALNMSFAIGNVFKALVRICKHRKNLGKPGSTSLYEAEKILYYSKRTLVVTQRRLEAVKFHFLKSLNPFHVSLDVSTASETIIKILDPKRLDPYSFKIGDFVKALDTTPYESSALTKVMMISIMRKSFPQAQIDELSLADKLLFAAEKIELRERLGHKTESDV